MSGGMLVIEVIVLYMEDREFARKLVNRLFASDVPDVLYDLEDGIVEELNEMTGEYPELTIETVRGEVSDW